MLKDLNILWFKWSVRINCIRPVNLPQHRNVLYKTADILQNSEMVDKEPKDYKVELFDYIKLSRKGQCFELHNQFVFLSVHI